MSRWKWAITFAAVFALVLAFALPSEAVMRHYTAQVYRVDQGKVGPGQPLTGSLQALTGITYKVLAIGTTTAETIYSQSGLQSTTQAAKTNPVTTTVFASDGGKIDFWCDPTDATDDLYVDLVVVDTSGGFTTLVHNMSPSTRTVVVDVTRGKPHYGQIWFSPTTTDETSTGITFAQGSFIHDVWVEVVTVASAATIDVGLLSSGTTGDADGFRKGVLLTTAGYVKDTAVITDSGTTIDYVPASTYGALLVTAITGTGAQTYLGGGKSYIGHVIRGTQTGVLTYTAYSTTAKGYLHYWFTPTR